MTDRDKVRAQVWSSLRDVAKPDSRFHYDFDKFIPDFEGSDQATEHLLKLGLYQNAKTLFITPDNCLEGLREHALHDRKTQIVPTYGIRRGMVEDLPNAVPPGTERFAATLGLLEDFGQPISLERIHQTHTVDLLVTGASVVSRSGVRFGKGHGFFDLEWAMLYEIGVVDTNTPVVALVHDCQVTDNPAYLQPFRHGV